MTIVNNVKNPIETYRKRTLYKIEETYSDGSTYHGYYVENSSKTRKRGQAYRWKTENGETVNIEDENAFQKAKKTLRNGFSF